MQIKIGEYVFIIGAAGKDAEFKHVGEKNTALTSFSLAVGKDAEGITKWAECAAWQKVSSMASGIKKGDIVLAIGTIKTREYEGKTYNTLNCEFVSNPAAVSGVNEILGNIKQADSDDFVEIGMSDSQLPF
jgi:hypothetical protein